MIFVLRFHDFHFIKITRIHANCGFQLKLFNCFVVAGAVNYSESMCSIKIKTSSREMNKTKNTTHSLHRLKEKIVFVCTQPLLDYYSQESEFTISRTETHTISCTVGIIYIIILVEQTLRLVAFFSIHVIVKIFALEVTLKSVY